MATCTSELVCTHLTIVRYICTRYNVAHCNRISPLCLACFTSEKLKDLTFHPFSNCLRLTSIQGGLRPHQDCRETHTFTSSRLAGNFQLKWFHVKFYSFRHQKLVRPMIKHTSAFLWKKKSLQNPAFNFTEQLWYPYISFCFDRFSDRWWILLTVIVCSTLGGVTFSLWAIQSVCFKHITIKNW